jgi:hypothetical protein
MGPLRRNRLNNLKTACKHRSEPTFSTNMKIQTFSKSGHRQLTNLRLSDWQPSAKWSRSTFLYIADLSSSYPNLFQARNE